MAEIDSGLVGRRVVVTGSSMGIGKAVALRLAKEGARVVVNARNSRALEELIEEINDFGGEALSFVGSVSDYDKAGELIARCVGAWGGIDVLINCAGIAEPGGTSILNIDPDQWQQLIDIHLHGTFNTCRQAAPIMAGQGGGSIINTSSHAFFGMYGGTGYAAGKGATNSLSNAMAVDLAACGIDVNVVCPGAKTRLSTGDDYVELIESLHSRGALSDERRASALNPADPEYVASLYALLASDLSKGITGQIFWGSGGYIGCFNPNEQEVLAAMSIEANPPWEVKALWGVVSSALNARG